MSSNGRFFDFIPFGGDYNPDQWLPEDRPDVWQEDMMLFRAASVNFLTLPVFSWAKLQHSEDRFDFAWLDDILDRIATNGIKVCLATPTAAQPAWMSLRYPDILPVDIEGRKRTHGKRVNFCPNSPSYRRFSREMARRMAERYRDHAALAMWHISNEYGTMCYCDRCAAAFRRWLERRYTSPEALNDSWNLAFWGHTIYSWDEMTVPSKLNDDDTCAPPKMLDYQRFMTDSTIECYLNEREAIRELCPDVPATTNMSGFIKKLDHGEFAKYVDVIGWDNYPAPTDPPSLVAFKHDIMRGLKSGAPFFMMEQSPNQQNWQPYNVLKRPGEVRRLSYQALARGADSVLFFQMRANRGGVEKLHGTFIPHAGGSGSRTYNEMADLGAELGRLGGSFTGARTRAEVALLFDWDNWWATSLSSGPSRDLDFFAQAAKWHAALYRRDIAVDVVRSTADLSDYRLVLAPVLYMVKEGVADSLDRFVSGGGTLVTSFLSGIVDINDQVVLGGYPGPLRKLAGLRVEEIDALPPGKRNRIIMASRLGDLNPSDVGEFECSLLCDIVHLEGAQVLATYGEDFYAGTPCLARNRLGSGTAYYVATDPEEAFLNRFLAAVVVEAGVTAVAGTPEEVEVAVRSREGTDFVFLINHGAGEAIVSTAKLLGPDRTDGSVGETGDASLFNLLTGAEVSGDVRLAAGDVTVLATKRI